jgi:hypothetical protein
VKILLDFFVPFCYHKKGKSKVANDSSLDKVLSYQDIQRAIKGLESFLAIDFRLRLSTTWD